MAVGNKKVHKKAKQGLNVKKVLVNNSNKTLPPASSGSTISSDAEDATSGISTTDLDAKEFDEFYSKALQQYLVYKQNGAEESEQQSFIVKATKKSLKVVYKTSVAILLIYLLKLYIVYQMRTYFSVANLIPSNVVKSYNTVRIYLLLSFQYCIDFLQKNLGIFGNLKLKNQKSLFVDNLITSLNDTSYRSNLGSLYLAFKIVLAIILDYLKMIVPASVFKHLITAYGSVVHHLNIFWQRVFFELGSLWKLYNPQSYNFVLALIQRFVCNIKCFANYSLEELKNILF